MIQTYVFICKYLCCIRVCAQSKDYSTGVDLTVDVTIEELESSDAGFAQPQRQHKQLSSQQQREDHQSMRERIKKLCYEEFRKQALAKLLQQMDDPNIPNSEKLRLTLETRNELKEKKKQEVALLHNIKNILRDPDNTDEDKETGLDFICDLLEAGSYRDIKLESLHFIVRLTQPSRLEGIWQKSSSGKLTQAFYSQFVTPQFMRKFDLRRITIVVGISEVEYMRCKNALLARGE